MFISLLSYVHFHSLLVADSKYSTDLPNITMQLKDHDQVSVAWGSRRGQRCLGFALVCV
jgi:hypothetical protein